MGAAPGPAAFPQDILTKLRRWVENSVRRISTPKPDAPLRHGDTYKAARREADPKRQGALDL